jgi:hypothetical protein
MENKHPEHFCSAYNFEKYSESVSESVCEIVKQGGFERPRKSNCFLCFENHAIRKQIFRELYKIPQIDFALVP